MRKVPTNPNDELQWYEDELGRQFLAIIPHKLMSAHFIEVMVHSDGTLAYLGGPWIPEKDCEVIDDC